MSLSTRIKDAMSQRFARVEPGGYLRVINAPYTTVDDGADDNGILSEGPRLFPWNETFTLNGVIGASSDMRVNGSVTPQSFMVKADNDYESWVTDVLLVLADAGISVWSEFGNQAALTNGVEFHWRSPAADADFGTFKTNYEMARTMMFGRMDWASNNVMRGLMSSIVGAADGFTPMLDLKRIIPPNGLQLRRGTEDRIEFIINDDLTVGLDQFEARAFGFRRTI